MTGKLLNRQELHNLWLHSGSEVPDLLCHVGLGHPIFFLLSTEQSAKVTNPSTMPTVCVFVKPVRIATCCPAMGILNEHTRFSSTGRGPMNYSGSLITLNSWPHADLIFSSNFCRSRCSVRCVEMFCLSLLQTKNKVLLRKYELL